jgi:hypothetical protein
MMMFNRNGHLDHERNPERRCKIVDLLAAKLAGSGGSRGGGKKPPRRRRPGIPPVVKLNQSKKEAKK